MQNITILGAGSWGTAIAVLLNENGHNITVWDKFSDHLLEIANTKENKKYLPGIKIPASINFEISFDNAVAQSEYLIIAIPAQFIRQIFTETSAANIIEKKIINLSKGIETSSLKRISEIFIELFGEKIKNNFCVLTGPSHAEEVAERKPTSIIAVAYNNELAEKCQQLFNTDYFRVYTNTDVIGAEIGGAVKNVIAIAAGVCDGLQLGDNARAALVTRGLAEIIRFGAAFGARPQTFSGLSGLGDLIVTCGSIHSRNYKCGKLLAEGKNIIEINKIICQTIEGAATANAVSQLAAKKQISMPICEQVNALLNNKVTAEKAVYNLMSRLSKPEFD